MSILKSLKQHIPKSKSHRFLLTAMSLSLLATPFITKPIQTYAKSFVTADGTKWETAPSDLPWAGSADRQGVAFYIIKLTGGRPLIDTNYVPFTLLASNEGGWQYQANTERIKTRFAALGCASYTDSSFHYPTTWTEDGTWTSTGGDTKAYLEEELSDGRQRWEEVVGYRIGKDTVEKIKKDRGKEYRICLESTCALKFYMNKDGEDYIASMSPEYGTLFDLAFDGQIKRMDCRYRTQTASRYGTANQKWIQSLANGMVFSDKEEAKLLGNTVKVGESGLVSWEDIINKGYGFATIKPTIVPIHTFNGTTPSEPEEPKPEITDGECSIYKVYYTQEYDKKGRELGGYKQVYSYSKHQTTNYIVIDSERGYAVEKWLHF